MADLAEVRAPVPETPVVTPSTAPDRPTRKPSGLARRITGNRFAIVVLPLGSFVALWHLATSRDWANLAQIPPPMGMFVRPVDVLTSGDLQTDVITSLTRVAVGLIICTSFGLCLAMLARRVRTRAAHATTTCRRSGHRVPRRHRGVGGLRDHHRAGRERPPSARRHAHDRRPRLGSVRPRPALTPRRPEPEVGDDGDRSLARDTMTAVGRTPGHGRAAIRTPTCGCGTTSPASATEVAGTSSASTTAPPLPTRRRPSIRTSMRQPPEPTAEPVLPAAVTPWGGPQ